MTECRYCRVEYDPNDAEKVRRHTEAASDEECCGKCHRKPACYVCYGHRCVCRTH
jgi:hypothetical protein